MAKKTNSTKNDDASMEKLTPKEAYVTVDKLKAVEDKIEAKLERLNRHVGIKDK